MMTLFPYKLLLDFHIHQKNFPFPNFIKDLLKVNDIRDFSALEDFLDSEIQQAPLQDHQSLAYFLFLSDCTLQCYLFRQNAPRFDQAVNLIRHRMTAIRNIEGTQIAFSSWEQYIEFMAISFQRIARFIPLEDFESYIDKIEWSSLSENFIHSISTLIGYLYLQEDQEEQVNKSRLWLMKAIHETPFPQNLFNHLLMVGYYQKLDAEDANQRMDDTLTLLKEEAVGSVDGPAQHLIQGAVEELGAILSGREFLEEAKEDLDPEHTAANLATLAGEFRSILDSGNLPVFSLAKLELKLAQIYGEMTLDEKGSDQKEQNLTFMNHHLQQSIQHINALNDPYQAMVYRLEAAGAKVSTGQSLPEKEFKEILTYFRKTHDYRHHAQTSRYFAHMLAQNKQEAKVLDSLLELFKQGNKRIEEGGFFLILKGMALANEVFLEEIKHPGVSWVVDELNTYFEEIARIVEQIPELVPVVRENMLNEFRDLYIQFEPVSHHHIQVYFRYQLYGLKLLLLGASLNQDEISLKLGNQLVSKLEDKNNPLSFIDANWEEFKDIPNRVRNSTLNKCINITKGDLPRAAEHLDFSYRNLRSYITFKEVNRLGFFLDLQETDNKQLEMGIRYMFYDLYKKGTIFEVVFDMPAFLVKYAQTGFFSQNLEEELNIKGTTAKKYIKIMIEIGLIRQDKNAGRKHFYKLIRENVMKRLGREQDTLIES